MTVYYTKTIQSNRFEKIVEFTEKGTFLTFFDPWHVLPDIFNFTYSSKTVELNKYSIEKNRVQIKFDKLDDKVRNSQRILSNVFLADNNDEN